MSLGHCGPDRTESFEPDHRLVKDDTRSTPTKTVYTCDGSCGIENCNVSEVIPESW